MALFGKAKEAKQNARNELMRKLSEVELLELLVEEVLVKAGRIPFIKENGEEVWDYDNKWITTCQSYYDPRERKVVIGADLFDVRWFTIEPERRQGSDGSTWVVDAEQIHERIIYSYTNSGYVPLHKCYIEGEWIELDEVLRCWAALIKERLSAKFPELSFGEVKFDGKAMEAWFVYTVPELEWKDWI